MVLGFGSVVFASRHAEWVLLGFGLMATAHLVLAIFGVGHSDCAELLQHVPGVPMHPPHPSACAVSMAIFQQGILTGADAGYLWVDGGLVRYQGAQTAFAIRREDVPPISMWPRRLRLRLLEGRMPGYLPIPVGPRNMKVAFRIADRGNTLESRQRAAAARAAIYRWATHPEEGAADSVLPPLDLHPGLERDPVVQRDCVAGAVVSAVAALVATFAAIEAGLPPGALIVASALGVALGGTSLAEAWRLHRENALRLRFFIESQLRFS